MQVNAASGKLGRFGDCPAEERRLSENPRKTRTNSLLIIGEYCFTMSEPDITGDIISLRKIEKLRSELASFRGRGGIKSAELVRFARKIGRRPAEHGSQPAWVSKWLPGQRPVSIHPHAKDLNRFTAGDIIDQFEDDLDKLEERVAKSQKGQGQPRG